MLVSLNLSHNNIQNNNQLNYKYNTPSFKMKMSELKGIDRFVAGKYKINPQPIKTLEKFREKCKELAENFVSKDYSGRRQETQIQRKAMLKEWYDYVIKENSAYTGAMGLMILGGITAGLKPKEDTLPPVLNKGVLANTVTEIQNKLSKDENVQLNFDKEYRINLQKSMMSEEKVLDKSLNGWVIIPSKEHDSENFEANVDKLKMLSHNSWCTKSFNAKPYLREGDFHVYMEGGKPKLGIRFLGDEIHEVQGEHNNNRIPVKYYDVAKAHLKDYKLGDNAQKEIKILEKTKVKADELLNKFPEGINNYPAEEILKEFGIKYKKDKDGMLIISHYKAMCDDGISFDDLGIDETRLFKSIKEIEWDADFSDSNVTDLGNLQKIHYKVKFSNSKIKNLGNLQSIGGDAEFWGLKITNLGNLQSIGGRADFNFSNQIEDFGKLEYVNGKIFLRNPKVKEKYIQEILKKNFPNGIQNYSTQEILETFGIKCKKDKDGMLTIPSYHTTVQENLAFKDFGIDENKFFKEIKRIERCACFQNSNATNLGNLEYIGDCAYFQDSNITSLGKLRYIGDDANFEHTNIKSLNNLQYIGGNAYCHESNITSLGNLQFIGGNAEFYSLNIRSLDKLQYIGGNADFGYSHIINLGKLQYIGGNSKIDEFNIIGYIKLKYFNFIRSIKSKLHYTEDINIRSSFDTLK